MDNHLYVGNTTVFLRSKVGSVWEFDEMGIIEERTEQSVKSALGKRGPIEVDGVEIYLPALPTVELRLEGEFEEGNVMVKCREETENLGIGSGRRSAIVKEGDKLVRLKGCGNNGDGFVVNQMVYPENGKELRGCCFEQTALREQIMSFKIKAILDKAGLPIGNIPYKIWQYSSATLPSLPKFCGVFETLGEKRLGSHLLTAVDQLLASISDTFIFDSIASVCSNRVRGSSLIPTVECISYSGPLDTGPELHEWTNSGVYKDNSAFINILELFKTHSLFQDVTHSNLNLPIPSLGSFLARIVWNIGYESGYIKRLLQNNDISWGYYIDHNPFEPHCNAHPNNFIILDPFKHTQLLAPVDFDMAYSFFGFINTLEEHKLGQQDYKMFQNWVNSERVALEQGLAGQENMANFEYGTESTYLPIQVLYRDLCVLGYRFGFEQLENCYPLSEIPKQDLKSILDSLLIQTSKITNY